MRDFRKHWPVLALLVIYLGMMLFIFGMAPTLEADLPGPIREASR